MTYAMVMNIRTTPPIIANIRMTHSNGINPVVSQAREFDEVKDCQDSGEEWFEHYERDNDDKN
jgi:hypothetical protein